MDPLVAVFKQMDDMGTINVEITTKKDFDAGNTILYRPPKDAVFNPQDLFPTPDKLTKPITNWIDFQEKPFQYTIYKDQTDKTTMLWRSDPAKFYFSEFFVLDSGIFNLNPDNKA